MTTEETAEEVAYTIKIDENDLDEERFISIWNIANSTMDGDTEKTRLLASKWIGFLCKHRFEHVVVSPTDAKYLDEWYERDNKLLHDWKPESDKVDVITQHACVPYERFVTFLDTKKFDIEKKYSPTRANRLDWFSNDWYVG